jgi:hypothetical protein
MKKSFHILSFLVILASLVPVNANLAVAKTDDGPSSENQAMRIKAGDSIASTLKASAVSAG